MTSSKLSFQDFKLDPWLQEAVSRLGYTAPTEIQQKSVPPLLEGRDVIGQSKTGSGKTAAYLLPTLQNILKAGNLALILVPTRELAIQVEEFAFKIGSKKHPIRMSTVIGGGSMGLQMRTLSRRPNLIIATPGRLMDHIQRGTVQFDRLQCLVLDEADRMLDMGFLPQIRRILQKLPRNRQTALFSATFTKEVRALAKEFMKKPVEVTVDEKQTAPVSIKQQIIETTVQKKNDVLLDELNTREGSVLIFTRTKHRSDRLTKYLLEYGYKVTRIHGGRTLAQRKQAIETFRSGQMRILVATDIAARGIDIAQVGHVINFDLPQNPEDYLHRVGRTGRAGASGEALSFVTPEDKRQWKMISRYSSFNGGR